MADRKEFVGVNPHLIGLVHPSMKRGWKVEKNGKDITYSIFELRIFNEQMGIEVSYGKRVEGFDGVLLHEPGGGGSVSFPFVILRGQLWIGLLEEQRPNMGGKVLDAPGGFIDPGESHFETAVREFEEEVGVKTASSTVIDLNQYAEPTNANRAFFDTSRVGEGNHYYAWEFTPDQVVLQYDSDQEIPHLIFRKDLISPRQGDRGAERIFSCKFYPWSIVAKKADIFCSALVTRLLIYLTKNGKANLTFQN